ncbi:CPBP family intramembrane glutamic endopeptidase [Arenimonas fontis]|uniref:CPBP family intramembrane metalloprotease n=1 Tax=Arenimonas fontis TaxID=2608255 RepID=A0A5B2ZA80_9GAMM|nr:CPBP family intramembrane glutamic endopeptidase [Arenimonas fontis]KAA2284114.1 CPBP family intramembrane metalloprotease [Arenimonas fontis]
MLWLIAAGAVLAYAVSLVVLAGRPGFSLVEPLFVLGVLGLGMPLLAWLGTRPAVARRAPQPAAGAGGLAVTFAYLFLFAVLVLGFGFSALQQWLPEGQARELATLALKWLTMVLLPLWLLHRLGLGSPLQAPRWGWHRSQWLALVLVGLALLAFQAVFGRGLSRLDELQPALLTLLWAVPLCFLWQCLEAGLTEEVLFRAFLQQRLASVLRSDAAAILIAALLFGLAHAPGLLLRGANLLEGEADPTLAWALAYSVVVIAPAGILFGVLWARTRSLPLVVALHGLTDTLPQLADFIRRWSPGA